MHGMINRLLQSFVQNSYGQETWEQVVDRSGVGVQEFEAMLSYEDGTTEKLIAAVAEVLEKEPESVLEDIGTYVVSDPKLRATRRLLRFGGADFIEFLHSLDDLRDRTRLAMPDLEVPDLRLEQLSSSRFQVLCKGPIEQAGFFLVGVLRAMADDYGALAVLAHNGERGGRELVEVELLDSRFSEGRQFDLHERRAG